MSGFFLLKIRMQSTAVCLLSLGYFRIINYVPLVVFNMSKLNLVKVTCDLYCFLHVIPALSSINDMTYLFP